MRVWRGRLPIVGTGQRPAAGGGVSACLFV
jgi:hypothetical protein